MNDRPDVSRRLISEVQSDGFLELRIETIPIPPLQPGQVLVRVEAAPLHPSDLGVMITAGDITRAELAGDLDNRLLRVPVPEGARAMMAGRAGIAMPVGNEGAGTVIAAGDTDGEALIGKTIACFGGGMFADYRVLPRNSVMVLPEGASARDGAAVSVNPLTALAMVETMRQTGAKALVHTAAASSLGQILQRICATDGIPLINIIRRPEQAAILEELGATHVLNSQSPQFMQDMIDAFAEVDATIAFDAVGGGPLAGMILTAMEAAQKRIAPTSSPYGSPIPKHAYIYGRLEPGATIIPPSVGMAWNVGGFLLPHFLEQADPDVHQTMIARVMRELTSVFAIAYTEEIALSALLDPEVLARATAKSTNEKYLIRPQL